MFRKLLSIAVCLAMCMALLPVSVQATDTAEATVPGIPTEGDVWDGSITQPTTLIQKDGVYYYEITKCSELAYVAQTGGEWLSKNYILSSNLILNDAELFWDEEGNLLNDTDTLYEWKPIGNDITDFTGIFDGNNFFISGVYINETTMDSVGFLGLTSNAQIRRIHIVNAYVYGKSGVGGVVGDAFKTPIESCSFSGIVLGESRCGGIAGLANQRNLNNSVVNSKNYGTVIAGYGGGGIAGYAEGTFNNCTNYGTVSYRTYLGGGKYFAGIIAEIAGRVRVEKCTNYGTINGVQCVGGVYGGRIVSGLSNYNITQTSNFGFVRGEKYVGGIAGHFSDNETINNSFNAGNITGETNVGGIVGLGKACNANNCYNIGIVSYGIMGGNIVGSDDVLWGGATFENCYYLSTAANNNYGCAGIFENNVLEPDGFIAKTSIDMKLQSTYINWNYDKIWSISTSVNGGYPYLQWQENMLSGIPVNFVQISETTLSLAEGDHAYLTATVFPANASNQSITWSSSDGSVATVSAAGKVTAVSSGTATITAITEDGGYESSCNVTVTERLADEYQINSIVVRDNGGLQLSAIPNDEFLATVSITNLASEGNTLVLLAAYSDEGQYQGMMWVSIEDLFVGATIKLTLPVDNSDGKIANLKAFTVASFSNMAPLGDVVSFVTE